MHTKAWLPSIFKSWSNHATINKTITLFLKHFFYFLPINVLHGLNAAVVLVYIVFPLLFQKGPESHVHCELLVFGLGADQAGEPRPRHPQRHLQQQRHCPSGTRGRGCHQTFQKGQSRNWIDEGMRPWPLLTHTVTGRICSNHMTDAHSWEPDATPTNICKKKCI